MPLRRYKSRMQFDGPPQPAIVKATFVLPAEANDYWVISRQFQFAHLFGFHLETVIARMHRQGTESVSIASDAVGRSSFEIFQALRAATHSFEDSRKEIGLAFED